MLGDAITGRAYRTVSLQLPVVAIGEVGVGDDGVTPYRVRAWAFRTGAETRSPRPSRAIGRVNRKSGPSVNHAPEPPFGAWETGPPTVLARASVGYRRFEDARDRV